MIVIVRFLIVAAIKAYCGCLRREVSQAKFLAIHLTASGMARAMQRRQSFENRLADEKKRLQEQAASLPHGAEKETVLRKIEQIDTASEVNEWISSPGLRSPG
jgi:hypothetical protein